MKFKSKLGCCLVMENVAFFNPHLRKIWGKIQKCCSKKWWVYLSQISKIPNFSDTQISTNNIFKDDSIFFLILLAILVIVRRYPGPDFDQIFEVPAII